MYSNLPLEVKSFLIIITRISICDNALTFANMVDSPDPDIDAVEFLGKNGGKADTSAGSFRVSRDFASNLKHLKI